MYKYPTCVISCLPCPSNKLSCGRCEHHPPPLLLFRWQGNACRFIDVVRHFLLARNPSCKPVASKDQSLMAQSNEVANCTRAHRDTKSTHARRLRSGGFGRGTWCRGASWHSPMQPGDHRSGDHRRGRTSALSPWHILTRRSATPLQQSLKDFLQSGIAGCADQVAAPCL